MSLLDLSASFEYLCYGSIGHYNCFISPSAGTDLRCLAGPEGSFVSTGACNLGAPGSHPDRDGYLSSWLCIYSAPSYSKHGVYSAAYGIVQ